MHIISSVLAEYADLGLIFSTPICFAIDVSRQQENAS